MYNTVSGTQILVLITLTLKSKPSLLTWSILRKQNKLCNFQYKKHPCVSLNKTQATEWTVLFQQHYNLCVMHKTNITCLFQYMQCSRAIILTTVSCKPCDHCHKWNVSHSTQKADTCGNSNNTTAQNVCNKNLQGKHSMINLKYERNKIPNPLNRNRVQPASTRARCKIHTQSITFNAPSHTKSMSSAEHILCII